MVRLYTVVLYFHSSTLARSYNSTSSMLLRMYLKAVSTVHNDTLKLNFPPKLYIHLKTGLPPQTSLRLENCSVPPQNYTLPLKLHFQLKTVHPPRTVLPLYLLKTTLAPQNCTSTKTTSTKCTKTLLPPQNYTFPLNFTSTLNYAFISKLHFRRRLLHHHKNALSG